MGFGVYPAGRQLSDYRRRLLEVGNRNKKHLAFVERERISEAFWFMISWLKKGIDCISMTVSCG